MLDFTRYEILTFDCYGTLIDWESGILAALRRILSAHGKKLDDATLLHLYGDFEQRSEHGTFQPYREVLKSVVRQFGEELKFAPTRTEEESLPESLPSWKPWPDTVAALHQLKTRFRLAILSNVDDDLFAATRPQLGVAFDEVITAQQAQA
jgi:2-haloacid dehalogenase